VFFDWEIEHQLPDLDQEVGLAQVQLDGSPVADQGESFQTAFLGGFAARSQTFVDLKRNQKNVDAV
jgi:hypothetical protein